MVVFRGNVVRVHFKFSERITTTYQQVALVTFSGVSGSDIQEPAEQYSQKILEVELQFFLRQNVH